MAQRLKGLPAMRETWVQSLGREDSLEKEMATHSSILAWRIPWTEEPGGHNPWGRKESGTTEQLHFASSLHFHSQLQAGVRGGRARPPPRLHPRPWVYRVCAHHLQGQGPKAPIFRALPEAYYLAVKGFLILDSSDFSSRAHIPPR